MTGEKSPREWDETDNLRALYEALGQLTVAFSDIELRLQQLLWALLGLEPSHGSVLTSTMSYRRMVRAARQLWELFDLGDWELDEESRARYDATTAIGWLFRELSKAEEERNKLVHSWWPSDMEDERYLLPEVEYPVPRKGYSIRWKAPAGTGVLSPEEVDLRAIRETAEAFTELSNGLAMMSGYALGFREGVSAVRRLEE